MALRELIEKWNTVMPVRITEQELLSPKENFVTESISILLAKVNLGVPANLYSQSEELSTFAKLDLCDIVNSLYKLTDSKNEIFYMDLIEPSPKRTLHLLQNLLNYVLYYDMVAEDSSQCKEAVLSMDALKTRKQNLQTGIQEIKIKNSINEAEELALATEARKLDVQIVEETARLGQVEQEWQKFQEKEKQMKLQICAAEVNGKTLQDELVSESQLEKLQKELESVVQDTEQLEKICETTRENNNADFAMNETLRADVQKAEEDLQRMKEYEKLIDPTINGRIESNKELKELQLQLKRIKDALSHIKATEIETKIKIAKIKQDGAKDTTDYRKRHEELERKLKIAQDECVKKEEKLLKLTDTLDELKFDTDEGEIMIEQILEFFMLDE